MFSKLPKLIISFYRDFNRLQIPRTASQLAFNTLFALIPLVALSIQVVFLIFGDNLHPEKIIRWLFLIGLPDGMSQWVNQFEVWIHSLREFSLLGLVISTISSIFLVNRLNESLSEIWEKAVKPIRLFYLWFSALLIPLVITSIFALITLATTTLLTLDISHTEEANLEFSLVNQIADWLPLVVLVVLNALLFRFIPGIKMDNFKLIFTALFVSVIMRLSGKLFFIIFSNLPNLQLMTGVLSTMPLLLIWVYWLGLVFLSGALALKQWSNGPLKPLHLMTWDQLLRLIQQLHLNDSVRWQDCVDMGLSHASWDSAMSALLDIDWVEKQGSDQYQLKSEAYEHSFDEIWSLISYQLPTKGDAIHLIFGDLTNKTLNDILSLMYPEAKKTKG